MTTRILSGSEKKTLGDKALDPTRKGYLYVSLGSFCISFAAFFVKGASVDTSIIAFYRLLFGAAALFLFGLIQGVKLVPPRSCLKLIVPAGFFFTCDILIWHKSILHVGPGIATIVGNFEVIMLALYGVLFLGEVLSWTQKLSIPLALLGLTLLLGLYTGEVGKEVLKGTGLAMTSAFFYAFYVVTLRRTQLVKEKMAPVANMAWVSISSAMFIFVFCLGDGLSFRIPDVRTGVILAVLGIFCQSMGWLLLSLGLPHLSPFRAGMVMLTQPAFSYLWDCLVYGTAVQPLNILGAIIAIAAIGMGIYNPSPRGKKRRPPPETTASGRYPPMSRADEKDTTVQSRDDADTGTKNA